MIIKIAEILATVIDTLMLLWFVPKFLGVSWNEKKWALIFPAVQLASQLICDEIMPGFTLLPMVLNITLVFVFALTLSPKTVWWDALATIAYVSVLMLTATLLYSVFSFFIADLGDILQGTDSKVRVLYLLTVKLSAFFCYILLLLLFRKDKSIEKTNAIMSLTLIMSTIVAISAIVKISAADKDGNLNIPVFIITFVICLTNTLLYVFINKIQKLQKSKYELSLIKERAALENKQAEDANIIWNNIRKVRHDIKNHLSVIKGYLEKGENAACINYINDIGETVESMGDLIHSGNSVIDYLINSKLSSLENVQLLISGSVGDFSDIKDSDMVCILGNVLDNAVEAVKKISGTKRIELYFSKKKQNRMIFCKNTVDFPVLNSDGELKSTKEDTLSHGLGHRIIEDKVKEYGGMVGYFEEDGMFGIQISIPEPIE